MYHVSIILWRHTFINMKTSVLELNDLPYSNLLEICPKNPQPTKKPPQNRRRFILQNLSTASPLNFFILTQLSVWNFPASHLLHCYLVLNCSVFLGKQYKTMIFRNVPFSDISAFTFSFLERSGNKRKQPQKNKKLPPPPPLKTRKLCEKC